MDTEHYEITDSSVNPEDFKIHRAIQVASYVQSNANPYVRSLGFYRSDSPCKETIVIEVDVERPQSFVFEVHRVERIGITFTEKDTYPEVVALRRDFPEEVPHLNQRPTNTPRSLCLYNRKWEFEKIHWTPSGFIERIRWWLSETSKGTLHNEDQPLEPFLADNGWRIILPYNHLSQESASKRLIVCFAGEEHRVLVAHQVPKELVKEKALKDFVLISLDCPPQQHGIIRQNPDNLQSLSALVSSQEFDLLNKIKENLNDFEGIKDRDDSRLILLLTLPKTRTKTGSIEAADIYAFLTDCTIKDIRSAIENHALTHNYKGSLELPDCIKKTDNLKLTPVMPHFSFSPRLAAVLNGLQDEPRTKITAIGVGALGSQIAMNLARSGYKDWTLIDEDFLLPHNLARHELSYIVGQPKARLMADNINALFGEVAAAKSIVANVLDSEHTTDDILSAFSEADVILDISTSVPVSRYLARDVETKARKISLFLNPSGHEFVLLAEDLSGTISLDSLEMQYYREIIRNELLISHLVDGAALRYGGSCRDVTSRIPHWLVSLHASIAAGALQDIMANGSAQSVIWRAAKHSGTVGRIDISLSSKVEIKIKEWLLVTDTFFLKKIQDLRASKLPNETGGVLIGSFDHSRKLIYVVDTVPSPSDSEEWPTYYYRGCEGLRDSVEAIKQKTMSNLTYIGEWHSHPDRASCEPSTDDLKVLDWLYQEMVKVDTPALILIAGEMGKCNWLLEEEG